MRALVLALLAACTDSGVQPPASHCFYENASTGTTKADYCVQACQIPMDTMPSTMTCAARIETPTGTYNNSCFGTYETSAGVGCCIPIDNSSRGSTDFYFAECK